MRIRSVIKHKKIVLLSLWSLLLASCAKVPTPSQTLQKNDEFIQSQKNHQEKSAVAQKYQGYQKNSVSLQDAAQLIVLFHPRIFQAKGN